MLVYRTGKRIRRGDQLWPDKYDIDYTVTFEGWFLFGVIPLYIRQTTPWKLHG